jgi:hypothetical protein
MAVISDFIAVGHPERKPIGIGSPIAEAPSHTTVYTDHVYGGSAVRKQ